MEITDVIPSVCSLGRQPPGYIPAAIALKLARGQIEALIHAEMFRCAGSASVLNMTLIC
jgi:hypothetical protein